MQPPHRPGFPPYGRPPAYGAPQYQGAPAYNGQPPRGPYPYQRPPPGPYGGGGRGGPRPPMPRPGPGGSPPQNTTLWIGKIARTLEADVVRDLLEACGPIKEWKPATDPRTGALKGFAFCIFRDPEGVLVALEVLNGMVIDGQALALKCNSLTEQYLQWFKSTIVPAAAASETGAPPPPPATSEKDATAPPGSKPKVTQEQLSAQCAAAKEKIEGLTADRPRVQPADATAAANEFLSSFGDGQPLDRDSNRVNRNTDLRYREQQREQQQVAEEGEIGHEPPPAAMKPPPLLPESGIEKIAGAPPLAPPVSREADIRHAAMLTKATVITRKRPLTTAFNDDDEEDETEKKTRKLIPIQYSAEELKAVHDGSGTTAGSGLPSVPVDPAEERRKQIMALVPKDQDGVFSYPVKWEILDSAPQHVKNMLSEWINKRIKALVGDDEDGAGFAEFIVGEVTAHRRAEKILANVQDVLDEDAAGFVMQLFKVVIFQTEELALEKQK